MITILFRKASSNPKHFVSQAGNPLWPRKVRLSDQSAEIYNPNQRAFDSPSFREGCEGERQGGEPADAEDTAILCRRCRRLTTQHQDLELYESCEECRRNPELALVTQKAAAALTQLADTINSGLPSDQRGVIRVSSSGLCSPFLSLAFSSEMVDFC
jgi:hypothetical protein